MNRESPRRLIRRNTPPGTVGGLMARWRLRMYACQTGMVLRLSEVGGYDIDVLTPCAYRRGGVVFRIQRDTQSPA